MEITMNQLKTSVLITFIVAATLSLLGCKARNPPLGADADKQTKLQKQLHDNLQWYLTLRSMERVFENKSGKEIIAFMDLFERLKRPSLHGDGDIEAAMQRLEARVQKVYGAKLKANPDVQIRDYEQFKLIWKELIEVYRTFPSDHTDIKIENIRVISSDPKEGKSVNVATLTFYDLKREVTYTVLENSTESGISCSLKPLPTRFDKGFEEGKKGVKIHYPE
jgi:hypothetical protein